MIQPGCGATSRKNKRSIRDVSQQSRKGRPPKNNIAMTASERKAMQRQREREHRKATPRWLVMRREIWQHVQSRYMLSNAAQVAHALRAVATAISATTIWQEDRPGDPGWYLSPFAAMHDPSQASALIRECLDALTEFEPEPSVLAVYPNYASKRLVELFCDVSQVSQNEGDAE